jgi:hypothetical protein
LGSERALLAEERQPPLALSASQLTTSCPHGML